MVTEAAYAALAAENATLRHDLAVAREELTSALQRLAALEAKKTPPPSFVKANRPERVKPPRRRRAPEQNRARHRETPTDTVKHLLRVCPDCGSRLGGVHIGRRRQVVDVPPPAAVVVTEHQVEKGWCAACQQWHEAALNLAGVVVGQRRLGVRVAALVAHLRTVLRLPIRSIQRYLADLHDLRISVGEIVGLLQQVATHGATTVTAIRDQARRRPVVHADETGWREGGHNGYAWLLATPEGERYVERHASRAGVVANNLLGDDFTGVLVTDFYGGYNDTPGGRHQRCWVHLLRDVHALGEAHPAHLETQVWVGAVQDVWTRLRTAWRAAQTSPVSATAPPAAAHGFLAPLSLADALQAETRLLGEQFVQDKTHPCHALAWRLWHFQHELVTGLRDPRVPLENNAAERAVRPLVVARKISGGTRSAQGSQTAMRLYSLAATWLAQGHAPLDEFRRLLQTPLPQGDVKVRTKGRRIRYADKQYRSKSACEETRCAQQSVPHGKRCSSRRRIRVRGGAAGINGRRYWC